LPTDCLQIEGCAMPEQKSRVRLTAGRINDFKCPSSKSQAFLWDTDVPTLALRATPTGRKTYVFESRLNGATIRINLGTLAATIVEARAKATACAVMVDSGIDPREVERQERADRAAHTAAAAARAMTVGEVWPRYLLEGKPKRKDAFKPGYLTDLALMAVAGGEKKKRGKGETRPGPLFPLMGMALAEINEDVLADWFNAEARMSKHQAARALMMFRGFLRWCAARPEYRAMVDRDAGKAAAIVEAMPQVKKRTDCIEMAQLPGWFEGTKKLGNRTLATYLDALLLTGARREEMAALKWEDVDFRWKRLTLADKVDATRTIPLTPYLAQQLAALPRLALSDGTNSPYVFASHAKGGRVTDPRAAMAAVKRDAGISALTIHGLRRSFSLLGEAAGAPAGAIAQVMGHKPSATAEGYRPRSVDALRPYLAQIETHILKQAGIVFQTNTDSLSPRVVAAMTQFGNGFTLERSRVGTH
jgi:integrase